MCHLLCEIVGRYFMAFMIDPWSPCLTRYSYSLCAFNSCWYLGWSQIHPEVICTDIHFLPLHPLSTTKIDGQALALEVALVTLSDNPKDLWDPWLPPAKEMQHCPPTLQILLLNQEVSAAELDFLLRSPVQTGVTSPVEFLSHQAWGGIKVSTSP